MSMIWTAGSLNRKFVWLETKLQKLLQYAVVIQRTVIHRRTGIALFTATLLNLVNFLQKMMEVWTQEESDIQANQTKSSVLNSLYEADSEFGFEIQIMIDR